MSVRVVPRDFQSGQVVLGGPLSLVVAGASRSFTADALRLSALHEVRCHP